MAAPPRPACRRCETEPTRGNATGNSRLVAAQVDQRRKKWTAVTPSDGGRSPPFEEQRSHASRAPPAGGHCPAQARQLTRPGVAAPARGGRPRADDDQRVRISGSASAPRRPAPARQFAISASRPPSEPRRASSAPVACHFRCGPAECSAGARHRRGDQPGHGTRLRPADPHRALVAPAEHRQLVGRRLELGQSEAKTRGQPLARRRQHRAAPLPCGERHAAQLLQRAH
jgi:hypothetical protein